MIWIKRKSSIAQASNHTSRGECPAHERCDKKNNSISLIPVPPHKSRNVAGNTIVPSRLYHHWFHSRRRRRTCRRRPGARRACQNHSRRSLFPTRRPRPDGAHAFERESMSKANKQVSRMVAHAEESALHSMYGQRCRKKYGDNVLAAIALCEVPGEPYVRGRWRRSQVHGVLQDCFSFRALLPVRYLFPALSCRSIKLIVGFPFYTCFRSKRIRYSCIATSMRRTVSGLLMPRCPQSSFMR